MSLSSDDNIKVYVRVRPPDSYANEIDHKPCLEVTSRTSLTLFSKPDPKVFTYDQVADPNTTQVQFIILYLNFKLFNQ
jgi:kinesin family protein 15